MDITRICAMQRAYFEKGETKNVGFRITQLKKLQVAIRAQEGLLLDALQADFSNYHIYFLLEFCIALGFRPETTDMIPFTGEYQPFVEQFMRSDLPAAMLIPLSGRVRSEIASSIIRYLEFHTESTINIRSLQVLHELFA